MYAYAFHARKETRPTTAKDVASIRLEKFKQRKQKEIMAQINMRRIIEAEPESKGQYIQESEKIRQQAQTPQITNH